MSTGDTGRPEATGRDEDLTVIHDTDRSRYVLEVDGETAGYADYVQLGDVRDFNHTVIDPSYRGRGLSAPLIAAALDATRAEGFGVLPSCSAVEGFIAKNPSYTDLVR
ncbi:MAG TPA: N-acetyltransferase [Candidatus Corynebacterium avicola]|uniref:N-acetyltransferase n=1 Tax=Candidatus Corynebacterium avicola TaxID=2838527 RepID=A0A9D1RLV4_9CORY|nr:N-acetyltransferase [Candidatus Corynebacterium avicola]